MAKRPPSGYATETVEICVDDHLDSATDSALVAELRRRKIEPEKPTVIVPVGDYYDWHDLADELRRCDDRLHFEVLLLRMMALANVPKYAPPITGKMVLEDA